MIAPLMSRLAQRIAELKTQGGTGTDQAGAGQDCALLEEATVELGKLQARTGLLERTVKKLRAGSFTEDDLYK